MLLELKAASKDDSLRETRIEYGDEYVIFDTTTYSKATQNKLKASDAFSAFNKYLAWIEPDRRAKIFNCYKTMSDILLHVSNHGDLIRLLIAEVNKLYVLMPEENIMHWMNFHSEICVPPGLTDEHYEGAAKERTYLRDDYRDLMGLSLALRPMIPIWGHYIQLTTGISGSDFKEYNALRLVSNCWISNCRALDRLRSYLIHSMDTSINNFSAKLEGLGSEEFPEYLLALSLIRRLAVGNLYPEKKEDSLISNIYNYIFKNVTGSLDRHFAGKVREKRPDIAPEGDNTSIAENYKVKQTIANGDLVLLNIFAEEPFRVLTKVDSAVPDDYLIRSLKHANFLIDSEIPKHYITLTQWVCYRALPPDGVMNLHKQALVNMICVTQACLWHWGFFDLAALITATPINVDDADLFTGCDTKQRISENLKDQLIELFPFFYRSGGNNPAPIDKQRRQNNPAVKAIDIVTKEINYNEWLLNCPNDLIAKTSATEGSRKLLVPIDIRNQLASLIIKLN